MDSQERGGRVLRPGHSWVQASEPLESLSAVPAGFFLQGAGEVPSRSQLSRWLWVALRRKALWASLVESSALHPLITASPPPRWLSYLLLFILDLVICLIACLGLAKRSRCLLAL